LLTEESEKRLISLLAELPAVIEESKNVLTAHKLTHYLIDVASAFNTFYHKQPVLQAEEKEKNARLALVEATTIVLEKGLELLNIKAIEEM
jgi:arginyl-tRNA synthetase